MSETIFCTNCGNKCESTFKFCNNCGTELILDKNFQTQNKLIDNMESNEGNIEAISILEETNYNKIEAIKKYGDLTGVGLKESKKIIEESYNNIKGIVDKGKMIATATLKYFGSHPYYPKECTITLKLYKDYLVFSSLFGAKVDIHISDVLNVKIETEKEVVRRFTATRIALFGPFALAMKKKKVNKKKYLIIECRDFTLTFEECFTARIFCKSLYDAMIKAR
ncbi:hypothetical protein JCM1393_25480 [Clostridium carnis]